MRIMTPEHSVETVDEDDEFASDAKSPAYDPYLEDYVLQLEKQLSVKAGMLEEALRLHRSFHLRLLTLEEGLAWKDNQLAELAQQYEDASLKASRVAGSDLQL
ncbi:GIP [Symbiodinium natans]|uniref:GIP protein n=1 Tax=Symbiodinium natans TaxID=878477 RepID=A0A812M0J6_9DINO|nr:GIP [Symbiodinium natans]